ncbi:hypothetical protein DFH09DRAFT_1193914 [Mycena vulgaris]|nr:hypothetical protein DFH09DRAFT_1193914 [Mycena vulgaris]
MRAHPVQHFSSPTPATMWTLPLLHFAFSCFVVDAAQVNYTIDDASPLVQYRAPQLDRNLTGFDPSRLNNSTVTFIPATVNDSPTISFNITGTAFYIFIAYPAGHNESFKSGFIARIDDVPSGGWEAANTAPMDHHLAYRNRTLSNGPHQITLQIFPEWELYFDYAIYTSGDPDPAPTSSGASPGNTTSSGASSGNTTSPAKSSSTKKFPVGPVVGGIVGGLLLLALISTPLLLRRRALAKQRAKPFTCEIGERDSPIEKVEGLPPATPFLLRNPPPPRSKQQGGDSTLSLGSPTPRPVTIGMDQSPLTPGSDPALVLVAEEIRRLREHLETDEARDGGPISQRPPAYGHSS